MHERSDSWFPWNILPNKTATQVSRWPLFSMSNKWRSARRRFLPHIPWLIRETAQEKTGRHLYSHNNRVHKSARRLIASVCVPKNTSLSHVDYRIGVHFFQPTSLGLQQELSNTDLSSPHVTPSIWDGSTKCWGQANHFTLFCCPPFLIQATIIIGQITVSCFPNVVGTPYAFHNNQDQLEDCRWSDHT